MKPLCQQPNLGHSQRDGAGENLAYLFLMPNFG